MLMYDHIMRKTMNSASPQVHKSNKYIAMVILTHTVATVY